MFALTVFVLFGFMALAIDLGRTYVVRTELQNAADAAALAGAMELNQTAAGVTNAVNKAIAIAAQNNFKFTSAVTITIADIAVGSCPDDSCMVMASGVTSNALAQGKTFIRVQIPSGALATFFARMVPTANGAGIANMNTYGQAVAGRFLAQITPLGVCAINLVQGGRRAVAGFPDELTEFGFRRGIAYNIPQLNPLGGASGDPLWINPLNAPPAGCDPASSSATALKPFVCTGTSTVAATVPGVVYANTGGSYGPMEKALNSRFDDFTGGNACDPATAPPDTNVKSYSVPTGAGAGTAGNPRDWMNPGANTYPSQQSMSINPATGKPVTTPVTADYGALWSYSRAVQAVGTAPNATAGTLFGISNAEWSALYAGNLADPTGPAGRTGYPTATPSTPPFPAGTLAAPYNTLSGNFFSAPNPAHPGRRERRVLNVAILDCSSVTPGPGLSCAALPVLGIGKFFMQRRADLTGGIKKIEAEFGGLLSPLPPPEIRLYR